MPAPAFVAQYIRLSGATGRFSAEINGLYIMSSETSCGYPIYYKQDALGILLEHYGFGTDGKWQVKPVYRKGQNSCVAFLPHQGHVSQCPKHLQWCTFTASGIQQPLGITMLFDADATAVRSLPWRVLPPAFMRIASLCFRLALPLFPCSIQAFRMR